MPGALDTIEACTEADGVLLTLRTTGTVAEVCPAANASNGTCALTKGSAPPCETETIGAVKPLKETVTPLSEPGKDAPVKVADGTGSAEVKIATRVPGATGAPAPFATA